MHRPADRSRARALLVVREVAHEVPSRRRPARCQGPRRGQVRPRYQLHPQQGLVSQEREQPRPRSRRRRLRGALTLTPPAHAVPRPEQSPSIPDALSAPCDRGRRDHPSGHRTATRPPPAVAHRARTGAPTHPAGALVVVLALPSRRGPPGVLRHRRGTTAGPGRCSLGTATRLLARCRQVPRSSKASPCSSPSLTLSACTARLRIAYAVDRASAGDLGHGQPLVVAKGQGFPSSPRASDVRACHVESGTLPPPKRRGAGDGGRKGASCLGDPVLVLRGRRVRRPITTGGSRDDNDRGDGRPGPSLAEALDVTRTSS